MISMFEGVLYCGDRLLCVGSIWMRNSKYDDELVFDLSMKFYVFFSNELIDKAIFGKVGKTS
jgi:hypothetical protein